MEIQTQIDRPIEGAPAVDHSIIADHSTPAPWSLARRIAFRFCLVYIVLYFFPFPFSFIYFLGFISEKYQSLWNVLVTWAGKHILHLSHGITVLPNGSGDTTWNYVQVLCMVVLAVAVTLVWSFIDRNRVDYRKAYQWLRLLVRFTLASALFTYGFDKAIPVQMPAPLLSTLIEPYGESSPMGLLWTFIGASRPYEIFTGLAEISAGLLMVLPRTTALGALIAIADMLQVFMLNMCYDVPVKLYSFHLLALSIFLIAPDLRRLGNLFFSGRQVALAKTPPMFARPGLNRALLVAQVLLGAFLAFSASYFGYQGAKRYGFLAGRPPLYGLWSVDEYSVDGQVRPPLLDDDSRWRRVIFDAFPGSFAVQLPSGARQRFRAQVDTDKKTLKLVKREDPNSTNDFSFEEPGPGLMTLKGTLDGHQILAKLRRMDEGDFQLTNRGFHWINEVPFNR
ncbi:MAG TPA: hypothetical protein VI756_23830 [Blastocatellia bacterium]